MKEDACELELLATVFQGAGGGGGSEGGGGDVGGGGGGMTSLDESCGGMQQFFVIQCLKLNKSRRK